MYNLIRNINKSKNFNKIIVQGQYGKKLVNVIPELFYFFRAMCFIHIC